MIYTRSRVGAWDEVSCCLSSRKSGIQVERLKRRKNVVDDQKRGAEERGRSSLYSSESVLETFSETRASQR